MTAGEIWAVAGLLLCAAELLLPGVFLLWIGLAALLAGVSTAALALGGPAQVAVFIAFALVLIAAPVRMRRRPQRDLVNAPDAGLIGASCTAVEFREGQGRVRFRDGIWPARTRGEPSPPPGENLRVVGLDGTTLLVERPPG